MKRRIISLSAMFIAFFLLLLMMNNVYGLAPLYLVLFLVFLVTGVTLEMKNFLNEMSKRG
ncbi:hypothetical protein [Salicibibacter kimchii]|uniref:Uncharacterized protein n=1 Tax=Salicibibacter kimchii TaxID=2099786 RepID=A0A345BX63_9BACI|nr:hypothetical protein [Salicibibacter kimchii]AXF55544.1 hypothetical protein DT065_05600 [Salicibibacter kimchii]